MKVGIMQPYFFPYIGYWQLIQAVDTFVVYDDVNYIKGGWLNRNYILINGSKEYFNLKLSHASPNRKINEITILADKQYTNKMLKTLEYAYKRAPFFEFAFPVVEEILRQKEKNLAKFLTFSIDRICKYIGIPTKIIISSQLNKDNSLKGEEKLILICKFLNGTSYINAIGGQKLYNKQNFTSQGIDLKFVKSMPIIYKQYENNFVPNLSIIDIMMFNNAKEIKQLLNQYELV